MIQTSMKYRPEWAGSAWKSVKQQQPFPKVCASLTIICGQCVIASLRLWPDIVISFGDKTNIRTLICLAGTGIPTIISERVHPKYHRLEWVWEIARRIVYRRAAALVVQTKEAEFWFKTYVSVNRIVVIPNAVRKLGDMFKERWAQRD